MGVVASACSAAGGDVHGIIPSALFNAPAGEKGRAVEGADASAAPAAKPVTSVESGTDKGEIKTTVVPSMHVVRLLPSPRPAIISPDPTPSN